MTQPDELPNRSVENISTNSIRSTSRRLTHEYSDLFAALADSERIEKHNNTETKRLDWIENNPKRLNYILYKGEKVWYVDAICDFKSVREAIDHGIKSDNATA